MTNSPVTPRIAVVLGLLLVVPGALFFSLLVLGIEPPLGPLAPLLATPPDGPNVVGTLVALTLILVLPLAGLVLNLRPLLQSLQAGSVLTAKPLNLILVTAALVVVLAFVAGVVIDQYPCWMGVPNCD